MATTYGSDWTLPSLHKISAMDLEAFYVYTHIYLIILHIIKQPPTGPEDALGGARCRRVACRTGAVVIHTHRAPRAVVQSRTPSLV